jgi:hypothetical protein
VDALNMEIFGTVCNDGIPHNMSAIFFSAVQVTKNTGFLHKEHVKLCFFLAYKSQLSHFSKDSACILVMVNGHMTYKNTRKTTKLDDKKQ